ncbi:tetratricopeptide repeat protein [Hydrogenimonas sp.]
MKKIAILVLFVTVFELLAASLKEGVEAFEANRFVEAQRIFLALEKEEDNPDVEFYLGLLYFTGNAGEKNLEEAGNRFERAARARDPKVKTEKFTGISRKYDRALYWFTKVAESGHVKAQFYLGVIYAAGRDVDVDYRKSAYWFEKAALQGDELSQLNIGIYYLEGQGVRKDGEKGVSWLEKAAKQGNLKAQNYLGYLYAEGTSIPQNYEKARAWYLKAADRNYSVAQYNLALMYCLAKGSERDLEKCAFWTKKAYENGLKKQASALWDKFELWKYLPTEGAFSAR